MNATQSKLTQDYSQWTNEEQIILKQVGDIYRQALAKYPTNELLILRYNEFLQGINDQQNQRSLLNNLLKLAPERKDLIWKLFHEFEEKCGTIESLMDLEERHINDVTDQQSTTSESKFSFIWVKNLFSYLDLNPFTSDQDMDYSSMNNYFNGITTTKHENQQQQQQTTSSETNKLQQFSTILPLNYQGIIISPDKLLSLFDTILNETI
ncbi:Suppressor of forked domain-containing protein [Entamoeba marina]